MAALMVLGYRSYRIDKKWQNIGSPNTMFYLDTKKETTSLSSSSSVPFKIQFDDLQYHLLYPPDTILYQMGRMPCSSNDFIVPGPLKGSAGIVSRFALRILLHVTTSKYTIQAGGCTPKNTVLVKKTDWKWCPLCTTWFKEKHNNDVSNCTAKDWDALTKNGVRVWLPTLRSWYEVSIKGALFPIVQQNNDKTNERKNLKGFTFERPTGAPIATVVTLEDGAILDISGVQVQFIAQVSAPSRESILCCLASRLESLQIQCPVYFTLLNFHQQQMEPVMTYQTHQTTENNLSEQTENNQLDLEEADDIPHVFPNCGHVFGSAASLLPSTKCPLCRTEGRLVPLLIPQEIPSAWKSAANTVPNTVFNPCGHAVVLEIALQYSTLNMPHGRAICPICAQNLHDEVPYSKLYFTTEQCGPDVLTNT